MALLAVLAGFRNFVLVICRPVLQVVHCEADGLGLAGHVVCGQGIGVGKVQFSQPFWLRQELPTVQLAVNRRVKDGA